MSVKLGISQYNNNFILKGGMLVSSLVGIESRSTVDMDTTIKRKVVTEKSVKDTFERILAMDIDDGIAMNLVKIEEIRDEAEYAGFRVSIEARFETAKIPLKVDITSGDEM